MGFDKATTQRSDTRIWPFNATRSTKLTQKTAKLTLKTANFTHVYCARSGYIYLYIYKCAGNTNLVFRE